MQPIIETSNLGSVTISQHVVKHFSKLCDGNINKATEIAIGILNSADIERLEVPVVIADLMTGKGDDPNAIEFWVHHESSTVFLIKPFESYMLVEMAIEKQGLNF